MADNLGDVPLPGDSSAPNPGASADATNLNAQANALERIAALYQSIIDKEGIRGKQFTDYSKMVASVIDKYDEMYGIMTGLEGKERQAAIRMAKGLGDQKDMLLMAEKYLNVQAGITREQLKQQEIIKSIQRSGEMMGLSQDKIEIAKAHAMKDFKNAQLEGSAASWTDKFNKFFDLIDIRFQSQMIGAMGRSAGFMNGAGASAPTSFFAPNGPQNLSNSMFGSTGSATDPVERMELLNKVLAQAPQAAGESAASMRKMFGMMGEYGANVDKITERLIRGARDLKLKADDLADVEDVSVGISKNLGLSVEETTDRLLDMYQALRQNGGTIKDAEIIMRAFSKSAGEMSSKLAPTELANLAGNFAQGLASMSMSRMAGVIQYATGKTIDQQTMKDFDHPEKTAVMVFNKILSQIGGGTVKQGIAAEQVATQVFGMNIHSARDLPALVEALKSGKLENINAAIEKLKDPQDKIAEGLTIIAAGVEPLKRIENYTHDILSYISGYGAILTGLSGAIGGLAIAGKVGGIANVAGNLAARTAAATAATAAGEAEVAGTAGIMGGAGLAGVASPLLVLGGAAVAGWNIGKAIDHVSGLDKYNK